MPKHKQTEEHKRKMVETRMKNGSYKVSEETKRKMSKSAEGHPNRLLHHSEETKKKMSETRKKLKIRPPRMYGKNNPNWNNGSSSYYRVSHAPRLKPKECEICGAIGKICLDHDHKTGKFRGWICQRCNFVLGHVKDNTETLMAIIDYLKKHNSL